MERLKQRLAPHSLLALDTSIFIYHFEANPTCLPFTRTLLNSVASGTHEAVISELVLLELLVKPLRLKRDDLADQYEILLDHFPHLMIFPIQRDVLRHAAKLRARYGIKTPDAIHLATALEHHATLFVCNDRELKPVGGMDVLVLSELR